MTALVTGLAGYLVNAALTEEPPSVVDELTAVRLVRPFDDGGRLLAPYTEARRSKSAKCSESYQSSDPDALRCFTVDSQALDPCWSSGLEVACLRSPWDSDTWIIEDGQDERMSSRRPMGPDPWALEVRNPLKAEEIFRCGSAGGANGTVAGMRINWRCFLGDASEESYVGDAVGTPQGSDDKPWKVFFSPEGSSDVREATVVTVWR